MRLDIGSIISRHRKNKNMTQKELANILEVSSNHLSLIENNKKGISKKLLEKLKNIFDFSINEKEILSSSIKRLVIDKEMISKLKEKERELERKEMELIDTYDFIREHHLVLSKKAAVNNLLINYFSETEKLISDLELKLINENSEFIEGIKPVVKTTMKKIGKKLVEIENVIEPATILKENKGEIEMATDPNLSSIENLLRLIPKDKIMTVLTTGQKRMAILTYVAQNLKIKWKEYNVEGCATGFSLRLWEGGRGTEGKRGFMHDQVSRDIDSYSEGAETEKELKEIMDKIVEEIIDHAIMVVERSLSAARKAKTPAVRAKYLKSMNNKGFLLAALQIAIILYATELLDRGIDIDHEYLRLRLEGMKENKHQLSKAWREFNHSEQEDADYEKLLNITDEILKAFEDKREMTETQLDKIVQEKLILVAIGQNTIENYIYSMMDQVSQAISGKVRLIEVNEMSEYSL
ncbi:helix-turn-helix domain-containing protein [Fusobacterium ulcerans]|uniref:helix-turn-helix domain-containing protein n=1 Tax=Fusobacterium ulcerans TaxID=861 RepID=UPI0027B8DAC8|nr:helix-turn-helix transcriptional regulator [Fusobacterium ulcerans]